MKEEFRVGGVHSMIMKNRETGEEFKFDMEHNKEIPMKVIFETDWCEGEQYTIKRCPRCKHSGSHWDLGKYCNDCGQKLDWSK